jgi:peptide/nickel transport system permease protein|tara:strand:+ start:189 stop:1109 length:921 start_codon:yes stop_codon:yes gene_type:complete
MLLGISLISFSIIHLAPGSPAATLLGPKALDPAALERVNSNLGLDKPIYLQYLNWISSIAQGDFGVSIGIMPGKSVADLIKSRILPTLELSISALLLALLVAIPIGVISATRQYSTFDHLATIGAFSGISLPNFWLALMLILVFSVELGWLPSSGLIDPRINNPTILDYLRHLLIPAFVLGTASMGGLVRFIRASMLEVLRQDYILTARAKGLSERRVLYKHALRNALLPLVTIIGMSIPGLLSGAVLVETVTGWPGMGRLAVNAVFARDYPIIMALVMIFSLLVILGNLIADIVYSYVDPRIRYE